MLWNELSYDEQLKVMELIEDALLRQTNERMQDGLVAALTELEMWSHAPCEEMVPFEEPYVAQAQWDEFDSEWDRIAQSVENRKFEN